MLDVIFGYVGVVIGVVFMLYPLYDGLNWGVNKYLGSVSDGEWKVSLPFSGGLGKFEYKIGKDDTSILFGCSLVGFMVYLVSWGSLLYGIGGDREVSQNALSLLEFFYNIGMFIGPVIILGGALYGLHKVLKLVHKGSKLLNKVENSDEQ